jgi:membrane peptidoglycan carboxypeptidase
VKVRYFKYLNDFLKTHRRVSGFILLLIVLFFSVFLYEFRTSRLQAYYFSKVGKELSFKLKAGESKRIRFPEYGPHDIRLGYTRIPSIIKSLQKEDFFIEAQAEISERLADLIDWGIFPVYHEKTQAGLKILDKDGNSIYKVRRPERIYEDFHEIPKIVVDILLFIENREILDTRYPYKNPAVEWDRLGRAVLDKLIQIVLPNRSAVGGSTIATQLEKYLHGSEGRTRTMSDKMQQMLSATYRAYLDGPKTASVRESIVLNYINSIPLAALSGYGEVNGLEDGLMSWYSADIDKFNELMGGYTYEKAKADPKKYAEIFKKVLSLFIAHRRPSFFLRDSGDDLNNLTDEHLHLFAAYDMIPPELRDEALKVKLDLNRSAAPPSVVSFIERKATTAIRTKLLKMTKLKHLYDLDHFDLTVKSTLNNQINQAVSEILSSLADKKNVEKYGLMGDRTLDRGDPKNVIYSVTLYERVGNVNLLRVQTDNLDRPFDINEGTRLDLGSTAKLRVLSNYLKIVSDLHEQMSKMDKDKLQKVLKGKTDVLTGWVGSKILENKNILLKDLLEAAMARTYSASPYETFFTGGGIHTFSNFKNEDNGKIVTVQEALRHSINLPFIRLMRDNLNYYKGLLSDEDPGDADSKLSKRQAYLAQFADKEGSYFMRNFYQNYRSKNPSEIVATLLKRFRATPKRLAVVFRYIKPDKSVQDLKEFIEFHLPKSNLSEKSLQSLYDTYLPGKYSLNDQGYLAGVHPLELWLVGYMVNHPDAQFEEIAKESAKERQEVYSWLMKKDKKHAQDVRIRSLIENEAFLEMHKDWKALGYPFQTMVPSLASAIGNSGDRPAALAQLLGIILNDGMSYPMERMERIQFAKKTPFETLLSLNFKNEGERVMRPEVAAALRKATRDVVENGTARRVNNAYKNTDGSPIPIGGKTGTGDNRYETFGRGGNLLTSRVVNRTATFAFYMGDKFFGTVTAHVQGPDAAKYDFTSALAAELLKALAPAIEPMVAQNIPAATINPAATIIPDTKVKPIVKITPKPTVIPIAKITSTGTKVPATTKVPEVKIKAEVKLTPAVTKIPVTTKVPGPTVTPEVKLTPAAVLTPA